MMIDEFEFDPNMTFTEPGYVSTYGCSVWSPFIRNWQQACGPGRTRRSAVATVGRDGLAEHA